MALYEKLRKKINATLTKYRVFHGQVYKRFIVETGGDSLIGKPGTVSKDDLEIIPPPAVYYPKYQGINQNNSPYVLGSMSVQVGDTIILLSADAITEEELKNPGFCFVIITNEYEEEFYIAASNPIHVEGKVLAYEFLLRSRARK